jgi:hypothetical protein
MPFKEIISKYGYTTDETGRISGSRHFVTDAAGPISALPVRGTSTMPNEAGAGMSGVLARRIRVLRDPEDRDFQYAVDYDSQPQTSPSPASGLTTDPASRSFEASAEIFSVASTPGAWEWSVNGGPVEEGLPLYKRAVLQNFSATRHGLTTAQKDALLGTIRDRAGSVNSAAFEGFAIGQVLFNGARGGDYTDESGVRKWSLELSFTARMLTGELDAGGAAITQDDWLYLYSEAQGGFDKPQNVGGTNGFLYRKTSFSELLS